MPEPASSRRRLAVLAVLGTLGVAAGVGWWLFLRPKPKPAQPDLAKAAHANARGIGHMEQFTYDPAVEAFEEAVKFAPDWTPAKINLGIALLNTQNEQKFARALGIFKEVLDREPDNPYAHFCTGIIHFDRGRLAEAARHFGEVTRIDPNDAHAWYFLAISNPDAANSDESYRQLETALRLNPYLSAARYALAQHRITEEDQERKKRLLAEFENLVRANAHDWSAIKYSEMGRYGEVIGKSPAPPPEFAVMPMFDPAKLTVKLADGTTWAADAACDDPRKTVRARFGGGLVLLDFNRDGKLDIFLPGAVVRGGGVRDVLLRNDGNNTFTDATASAGLDKHPGSFGAAVGDFDNDTFPDLAVGGPAGLRLFRNTGGKGFEDATAAAGFDKAPGVYFSANWIDLDQDGDLDLVAARHAGAGDLAPGLVAFANAGVAPARVGQPAPPLSVAFKPVAGPDALLVKGPVTGVVATDVDGDLDVDLIVLVDGQPPVTVLNDRMLRFHRGEPVTAAVANWNGGLALDANGDDQPDLVILRDRAEPLARVGKTDEPAGFVLGPLAAPPLRSAAAIDLDLDGRTDLVGLSADGKPVFLQGDGAGRFARKNLPFGPEPEAIPDLLAAVPADLDGDGNPDLLAWSAGGGPRLYRSLGNGNHALRVALTGMRITPPPGEMGKPLRTNADGVGAWARVHAGPLRTAAENTTLFAGLGQSRLPLHFGLGKADAAEAVRVRWPDAVIQAELNQAAGLVTIVENDRKPSSCPILFTWDGKRFVYVTDFLGAGSVGEMGPDGSTRPPRPEESVKIEPNQLVPKNGKFVIKVGEPMDEVMYLDRLRLDVIDHPAGTSIFPDERFATADPQPTQERLFFRDAERIFAAKATDHRGRDVTATLRERDGQHVEGFVHRSWLGFAEDHFVQLDFGPAGSAAVPAALPPAGGRDGRAPGLAGRKVVLVLAGWTDYAFPESIYAATQAGVPPVWPVLEQRQPDGTWKNLGEIGLPAGLTRVMTADVTGKIDPAGGPVRIRTNLQIYWDQIFLAPVAASLGTTVRELPVSRASLEHRGFTQEYSPNGKLPIAYDYDRLENVTVTRWKGKLTRSGDVTELLAETDDRHVVCGPGDEVTAEFDAAGLPPLPPGWQRSFVLRTWGYCKDTAPTTATGGAVGPLPYRAMPTYPYDPAKTPPPADLIEYDRVWNTRPPGQR